MPNNIIYLSQNAINNSNGTKNSFNGAEVVFAQAKGDNLAETNTSPLLDPAWLQSEIDRLNVLINHELGIRLPRLVKNRNVEEGVKKRLEYEINTGSLSMPFYCVSKIESYFIASRFLKDRFEACQVCNNIYSYDTGVPVSVFDNMDNCTHYNNLLYNDGIPVYSLDITGGCSTEGFGNGWNITEGVGACEGDGSFTPWEIHLKKQMLETYIYEIFHTVRGILDLHKRVDEAKKKRADLEMKLQSITI